MLKPKGKTRQKHNKKGNFGKRGAGGSGLGAPWGVFYIPSPAAIPNFFGSQVTVSWYLPTDEKTLKKTTLHMPPPKKKITIKEHFTSI